MSGFCTYLSRDGKPIPEGTLAGMMRRARHRGPDGSGHWASPEVALGHLQMRTTPESEYETQPCFDAAASLCVTLDGRLDNRSEIMEALSLYPGSEPITDVCLVLKAYERWGVDCADKLVGDFAFALWDARNRRLFCARDALGVRPFYYVETPAFFAASSGLPELLECEGVSRELNEVMVGEYLSADLRSRDETLYQHVRRLPAGHCMIVERKQLRVFRFWKPEEVEESTLSEREHAERLNELLRRAMLARVRSNGPLAVDLSGGLDSSSVACMISQLEREGLLSSPFECFSLAFPGLKCDETEYAKTVVSRWGCAWNRNSVEPPPVVDYAALAHRHRDFPGYPNGSFDVLLEQMRSKGMRVSLSGLGGDEWFAGGRSFARLWDFMIRRQWAHLNRELSTASFVPVCRALTYGLAGQTLRRFEFQQARHFVRSRGLPAWLNNDFVRRTELLDRLIAEPPRRKGWGLSRHHRLMRAWSAWLAHTLELKERDGACMNVEFRHPFLDRRIAEFALSLPELHCRSAETTKVVMREAMATLLPREIASRRGKAQFSHLFWHSLGRIRLSERSLELSVGRPGWVDVRRATFEYHRVRGQSRRAVPWPLWMLYGIHTWRESLDSTIPCNEHLNEPRS